MNKIQRALNNIVNSSCKNHGVNGCEDCKIKSNCNSLAKEWVQTIQKLIDKTDKCLKIMQDEVDDE